MAGQYTLIVDANGDTTPSFAFRLLDLSNATTITPGTAVSGSLTPARETDVYKFDATAGQRFYFNDTINSGGDTVLGGCSIRSGARSWDPVPSAATST